jgi:hypothetical protein
MNCRATRRAALDIAIASHATAMTPRPNRGHHRYRTVGGKTVSQPAAQCVDLRQTLAGPPTKRVAPSRPH